ncbi:MAG TPA: hypothetical protein VHX38_28705 [Pseudonocardiaceae bacterium]|nr:hypothetical protein [Pseudonocardiaceae bacterium]
MPIEIGLWRVEDEKPIRLRSQGAPKEAQLEQLIEADPTILGEPLLVIGRQVPTSYGTFIDLLAVDADGVLHVLELKRDRTPREVVAQVLDYGSWVTGLTHDEVLQTYASYKEDVAFEEAFAECFGTNPPDELNTAQRLSVIASEVDAATERIVTYLNTGFGVPVNVVFFRYYMDDGREYLARTWLVDETTAPGRTVPRRRTASREEWNGTDWYVSFGEETSGRNWDDARQYGFVSAGGGEWYSRVLQKMPEGARIFVNIPKNGYVGVGTVTRPAVRFSDAVVTVGGEATKLKDCDLKGIYERPGETDDTAEYVVGVDWIVTRPRTDAIWQRGMFANQHSACHLSNKFTIDRLTELFKLSEE